MSYIINIKFIADTPSLVGMDGMFVMKIVYINLLMVGCATAMTQLSEVLVMYKVYIFGIRKSKRNIYIKLT